MALPTVTSLFDVADAKVWPLLTDDIGGTPTWGEGVDVPGINQVSVEPELISAVLKGDARTLARRARIDSFNFSFGYSQLNLAVLGLLWNAQVTEEGETTRTLESGENNKLPYIAVGFSILDADQGIGAVNVYGLKTQITATNAFDQSTESFGGRSFGVAAIPLSSTGRMFRVVMHDTAAPLAIT